MGLDNGFLVKGLKAQDIPSFLILPLRRPFKFNSDDEIEIAYWRKCWGVREAILQAIHGKEGGFTPVEAEDFPAIIRALIPFFSEKKWEEEGESIWAYEEVFENNLNNITNLKWLSAYIKEHPEIKCRFYDSF